MRTSKILWVVAATLCLGPAAWGQRTLSNAEIQQILQQVTSRPRNTWLPVGTIQASHQEYGAPKTTDPTTIRNETDKAIGDYQNNPNKKEKTPALQKMKLDAIPFNVKYKLSNESAQSSHVTVKYDNGRFYWEINIDSRQDSVTPDAGLAGNDMTEQIDLRWNKQRIFTWDGQEYTTYSVSGNHAVVDAAGKLPRAVTGPLTAGLIPWGYGRFTMARLAAAQVSAQQNAGGTIDMTLAQANGVSMNLTLDPAKAYAVTNATLTSPGGLVMTYTCSDYRLAGSNWVPWNIRVERQNDSMTSRLPTSEQWTFSSVNAAAPAPGSFDVSLKIKALVEYSSPVAAESALYVQSDRVDARSLLAQRLAYAAGANSRRQNCATAALQQAAAELGKTIPDQALARLVGSDGWTSLYDMKRCAESQGLYGRAVQTDLATLQGLAGVKAILHIPGKNHFVVLDAVDDREVWITDLASRKFHYSQSVDFFPMDWSEGVALLLSDRPISGSFTTLPDAQLASVLGGAYYACNQLLQESYVIYCDEYVTGCSGSVDVVYERWGCGPASSGSCSESMMTGSQSTSCLLDSYLSCTVTGEWYYSDMRACG
ncbi:MAG: cysteine peptidase family C39 domain-containing protein [Planctomycetes bacterium]|nr:cysteine peptidase family C39 domain-containing protein [Planctomycetota bacterium]